MLNTVHAECRKQNHYVEYHYTKCRYSECRGAFKMSLVLTEEFESVCRISTQKVFKNIKMKQTLNSIKKATEKRTMKLYRDVIHSVP